MNRPGLQLAGFFDYFDDKRLQVIGRVETTYLEGLTSEERRESLRTAAVPGRFPALIISRELEPYPRVYGDGREVSTEPCSAANGDHLRCS